MRLSRVLNEMCAFGAAVMATSLLAEEATTGAAVAGNFSVGMGLIALASGLAIGLAALGAATGQGKAVSSAVDGIARNPSSKDQVFTPMILGLVFMEFQALMGFIIAILLWFTK